MLLNSELFPRERKTALPGGYMGKMLRVDLSSGSMKDENLPEEPVLRKLLGGQALALYMLLHELPLDAKPLGPESKVVLMTGPITGTGLTPGGTKVTAIFLSPLTGHTLGRGAASGFWAVYLKAAGMRCMCCVCVVYVWCMCRICVRGMCVQGLCVCAWV